MRSEKFTCFKLIDISMHILHANLDHCFGVHRTRDPLAVRHSARCPWPRFFKGGFKRVNDTNYLEYSRRYLVRANLIRWNSHQVTFKFSEHVNIFGGVVLKFLNVVALDRINQGVAHPSYNQICSVDHRSEACSLPKQGSLVHIGNELSRMCVLASHDINRDSKGGDGAHSLHRCCPVAPIEVVLYSERNECSDSERAAQSRQSKPNHETFNGFHKGIISWPTTQPKSFATTR